MPTCPSDDDDDVSWHCRINSVVSCCGRDVNTDGATDADVSEKLMKNMLIINAAKREAGGL